MRIRECFVAYKDYSSKILQYLAEIPENVQTRVVLAWEKGGLLTPSWTNEELNRLWLNVIAHQTAVASLASRLCHPLYSIIENEFFTDSAIIEAALVHDAFKRREWEINQRAKTEGKEFKISNREAEHKSSNFLKELGFEDDVRRLAKATGDLGLELMLSQKATISEQIVFYADCCVSDDQIVGYKKRFDDLFPHFKPGGRYDWVDAAYQERYQKTHREMWDSVVLPIQERLAQLSGFRGNPDQLHTLQ